MPISFPRETDEPLPVTVTLDGVVVTSGVQFQITPSASRPTGTWTSALIIDNQTCVRLQGLVPGWYRVWAQPYDDEYSPVVDCGIFEIT